MVIEENGDGRKGGKKFKWITYLITLFIFIAMTVSLLYSTLQTPTISLSMPKIALAPLVNNSISQHKQKSKSKLSIPSKPKITRTYYGRFGNKLFQYASLMGIADSNQFTPVIPTNLELFKYFEMKNSRRFYKKPTDNHPYTIFSWRKSGTYNESTRNLTAFFKKRCHVQLEGYFQSFKYFLNIWNRLKSELHFNSHIKKKIDGYMKKQTSIYKVKPKFVGMHIRRSDFLKFGKLGYVTAPKEYFMKAMDIMKDKFKNVHFFIATDEKAWVNNNLLSIENMTSVSLSHGFSFAEDMALLTSCNHTIISCGSFSWWVGWLANGTTIYYRKYPVTNTTLGNKFRREDYYPSNWIPLS